MFNFDVEVYPFNSSGNTKAFASVIIEGVLEVKNFKVIESRKGDLFVGVPQREGKPKDGERQWYPDIIFREEKAEGEWKGQVQREIEDAILAKYQEVKSGNSRGDAASAHSNKGSTSGNRPASPVTDKALW